MPLGQYQDIPRADPGGSCALRQQGIGIGKGLAETDQIALGALQQRLESRARSAAATAEEAARKVTPISAIDRRGETRFVQLHAAAVEFQLVML
jgi:hypothetical protein